MADIFYPDEYLPMPLMDGYGFKPISPLLRTEMTSGRAQQRRRYTSTPTQASVKWIFKTDALAQVFEAFFRDALKDGQSWFYLKLQTPIGVKATGKSRQWQKRNPRAWIAFRDLQLVIEHHNDPNMGNR